MADTASPKILFKDMNKRLIFQFNGKEYSGASALDIVRALEGENEHYPHRGPSRRTFLQRSLESLGNRLPPRDMDLSDRLEDEELALSFLYLQDEYRTGKLSIRNVRES